MPGLSLYLTPDIHSPLLAHPHIRPLVPNLKLCLLCLQILKLCPKKKSSAAYTFCKAMGLLGMQFHLFENECKSLPAPHVMTLQSHSGFHALFCSPDYPHGITILSPFGSDKKQVLHFCAQSAEELLKFVEDLKESIAEVSEMEQIRIECECQLNFTLLCWDYG